MEETRMALLIRKMLQIQCEELEGASQIRNSKDELFIRKAEIEKAK